MHRNYLLQTVWIRVTLRGPWFDSLINFPDSFGHFFPEHNAYNIFILQPRRLNKTTEKYIPRQEIKPAPQIDGYIIDQERKY